jgi:DNA (cytosine-5)-methyltransferase 1
MPRQQRNGLRSLSLFSGGGGLDIGFDRAGFEHVASYEILSGAAEVLRKANPRWLVYGGASGDVTGVDWRPYRGRVDVIHGGPPCQPFSHAGRRRGAGDVRDMIPELVRAVQAIQPEAFVCENVSGLITRRFEDYVQATIYDPLKSRYHIRQFSLEAADFGVPQRRHRVFFVGFRDARAAALFSPPSPSRRQSSEGPARLPMTMGARKALGLPDIGFDCLAPTLRSGLTGPRHTTSVLNSVTAQKVWQQLQIWPNGVAPTREQASAYVAKNGHFRLSVPDCLVLQGFPPDWPVDGAVYFALGLIGNSVAPPMGYHLARSLRQALTSARNALALEA